MNTLEIHTFEAQSMPEALAMVRKQLGPQAVILQTRQQTRRALTGKMKPGRVEIIAAPANETSAKLVQPGLRSTSTSAGGDGNLIDVQETIAYLTQLVDELYAAKAEPADPIFDPWRRRLAAAEFPQALIDECIGDLQHYGCDNDWLIRTRLREFLQTKLDCRPGVDSLGGGRMLALVGPPGSGKTTTLAKLAAQAALVDDRKVLTISTDCRRIGAIDQARKFCQIIGVAFEAPQTPEELQQAIGRAAGFDLTLIDADSDSLNSRSLNVHETLTQAGCESWLTVDVNLKASSLAGVMKRYAPLRYSRAVLTKLDEADDRLGALGTALRQDKPICFVTDGQRVPDDLHSATADWLASYGFSSNESSLRAA